MSFMGGFFSEITNGRWESDKGGDGKLSKPAKCIGLGDTTVLKKYHGELSF